MRFKISSGTKIGLTQVLDSVNQGFVLQCVRDSHYWRVVTMLYLRTASFFQIPSFSSGSHRYQIIVVNV